MTDYCPWCRRAIQSHDRYGKPQDIVLADWHGEKVMFHKKCESDKFRVSLW